MSVQDEKVTLLEKAIREETDQLKALKALIKSHDKEQMRVSIAKTTRNAKSYRGSLRNLNSKDLPDREAEVAKIKEIVLEKRNLVADQTKRLQEFENIEPTNEAMSERIEELKKTRLSLEMSFFDN